MTDDDPYSGSKDPLIFNRVVASKGDEKRMQSLERGKKRPSDAAPPPLKHKTSKLRDSRHVDVGSMLREFGA
jgi:hypothetical protein